MRFTRRECLKAATGGALALAAGGAKALARTARAESKSEPSHLGMPGLYKGRVIAVQDPGVLVSGHYQAEPIRRMMRLGMKELTGADGWADAWRRFFEPGDVVGIKVNPVGRPYVISDATVVHEIIAGLEAAGVKRQDIVVYDRYRKEFLQAGFDQFHTSDAVQEGDAVQQGIEGDDPDHYMDMALTLPGYSLDNAAARRSYAARFITREVNKLVNLPVLKDHQSAGVTLALKNMSHGLVNNVSRSHSSNSLNACNAFIPTAVSIPVIRNKVVLHILDGVKGLYHGGPFGRPQFVWEHQTLYFATDPVALDHIGWEVIDAKRLSVGKKKLVEDTPDQFSTFVHRQPEHVEIAGALGLGEWDRAKIDLRPFKA
ncbi:MAG: hypothetical protein DMG24_10280 [Acidobacteria bacterium]|nr:MAG: hypothetical protein DMG24_10280 [Acidobacteriota bacterium]